MKNILTDFGALIIILFITFGLEAAAQAVDNTKVNVGAYYFDGWTGYYPSHITKALTDSFPEREPSWGWITSKPEIIDAQIKLAANSGLSFFSFCWYYASKDKYKTDPLNQALRYYLQSSENKKLKYCLMVANHSGFEIGPADWETVSSEWIGQFKNETYLTIGGKPLIIFFSMSYLLKKFGTTSAIKSALDLLRTNAVKAGLKGVNIAICAGPDKTTIDQIQSSGFDTMTGYNYHSAGFTGQNQIPINDLIKAETKVWSNIVSLGNLKYIPVTTVNWDPRPWADSYNNYATAPFFKGFSFNSVNRSIQNCIKWLKSNPNSATADNLALIYAWNEYGEGAYLTPSKNGTNMLDGVKKAIMLNNSTVTSP